MYDLTCGLHGCNFTIRWFGVVHKNLFHLCFPQMITGRDEIWYVDNPSFHIPPILNLFLFSNKKGEKYLKVCPKHLLKTTSKKLKQIRNNFKYTKKSCNFNFFFFEFLRKNSRPVNPNTKLKNRTLMFFFNVCFFFLKCFFF